eukprot:gnl/TRDRNA2_/TRDRNA2_175669_c0_seq5.p1 gnl/TRDRNA2_/TRDRNA2_175669_c0~~gnl/TRDRNA2_/TRDRNA2_175669_c0_seq5.p1  ORF type:complete len:359 (+),score=46.64 gnl/TRDRNA2_/TRDRNA2_175669_c0_seq5:134-1078(+)
MVDGVMMLDKWGQCCTTWTSGVKHITAGAHEVVYEMKEHGGGANAKVLWDIVPKANCPPDVWAVEFFKNTDLSGHPSKAECTDKIDYQWGSGGPSGMGKKDHFSMRATKTATFDDTSYIFTMRSDDGSRLMVDGSMVLDKWGTCCTTWESPPIDLTVGNHTVVYEMREHGGAAYAELSWQPIPPPIQCPTGQWAVEFFKGTSVAGIPKFSECKDEIDYSWGNGGPPGLGKDDFSLRGVKTEYFQEGSYVFEAASDDGSRIWLDNDMVLDKWGQCCKTWHSAPVHVHEGNHTVVYEMKEHGGGAYARIKWEGTFY